MKTKKQMRSKRKLAIRYKVKGTKDRPRLAVHRSNTRLSIQIIDDEKALTLFASYVVGKNIASAKKLGIEAVQAMKSQKISSIVFDRSGFRYHGAVKAIAETIREGGVTI